MGCENSLFCYRRAIIVPCNMSADISFALKHSFLSCRIAVRCTRVLPLCRFGQKAAAGRPLHLPGASRGRLSLLLCVGELVRHPLCLFLPARNRSFSMSSKLSGRNPIVFNPTAPAGTFYPKRRGRDSLCLLYSSLKSSMCFLLYLSHDKQRKTACAQSGIQLWPSLRPPALFGRLTATAGKIYNLCISAFF